MSKLIHLILLYIMKTDFEITPETREWKQVFCGIYLDDPTWQEIVCIGLFRLNTAFKCNEYTELRKEAKEFFKLT